MWNFDYGLNSFNSFNMFNYGFSMPSFFNFGLGQNYNFTPLFNYSMPTILPFSFGSFGYTPSFPTTTTKTETKAEEAARINNISGNKNRIIEYNKTNYNKDYYGIVDKKNCKLTIYDKNGKEIKSYTLGLGEDTGDGISGGKYTTAGEFTLDENVKGPDAANYTSSSDNKYKFMALRGDNIAADGKVSGIHMLPNSLKSKREGRMKSETTDDNRMSNGCVNMLEADYDDMCQYLGEGCKIYILPEEDGNELQLAEQRDGNYKFEQTNHKDDERGLSSAAASVVIYDTYA